MDLVIARTAAAAGPRWRRRLAIARIWLDVWSERRELAALDVRMLNDLGLSDHAIAAECARLPWDIPDQRRMPSSD